MALHLAPAAPRLRACRRERAVRAADPATLWPPLAAVGMLAAAAAVLFRLVAPGALDHAGLAIGLVGIVVGVPHGSVDHLVPFWVSGRRVTAGALLRVLATYVLVAGAAVTALLAAPSATFVVFLAVSVVHFGRAEVEFVAARRAATPAEPAPALDRLRAAAHGLTVVAVPVAVWHDRVHDLLVPLAPALAGRAGATVFAAGAALAVVLDLVLLRADLYARRRQEAAETVLLFLLMAAVPPLPAFGVYFGGWHALRHTARLLALPGRDGRALPVRVALWRYARHASVPTCSVLVALTVVSRTGSSTVLTSALVVLVALTFPHMRTVATLDRAQHADQRPVSA